MIGLRPVRGLTPVDASAAGDEPDVADWPTDFVQENALPLQAFAEEDLPWQIG